MNVSSSCILPALTADAKLQSVHSHTVLLCVHCSCAPLPSPTASTGVMKPSVKGSSRAAACQAGSIPCTEGDTSSHSLGAQARQQAGTAGCDISGVLNISSHAPSRLHSKPSQPLSDCADQTAVIQPVQQAASRAGTSSGQPGNHKAQGQHQHSTVRTAGVKHTTAGRVALNAAKGQGSSCPCLQDIVGIAVGPDSSSRGHLLGKDRTTEKQKAGMTGVPRLKGSFAKAACKAAQPVDQQLQCMAEGFHGMLGEGVACNPSRPHVSKQGTDMQRPSMQTAKSVAKVSPNAVRQAKAHKAVSTARCEALLSAVLDTAGVQCRPLQ